MGKWRCISHKSLTGSSSPPGWLADSQHQAEEKRAESTKSRDSAENQKHEGRGRQTQHLVSFLYTNVDDSLFRTGGRTATWAGIRW